MSDKFLGLDLSLTGTGIITIDKNGKIDLEALVKSKKNGETPTNELFRLNKIIDEIKDIIDKNKDIKLAAIEGIAYGVSKTTHLAQLSALNYMVRNVLCEMAIPFVVVAPKTLKKYITETGNASKEMMMLETLNRFGESFGNDNLCDAYGLAQIAKDMCVTKELTKDRKSVIIKLKKQL